MPIGDVENYQGTGTPTVIQEGYDTFIGVYNDAATALANGSVVEVAFTNSTNDGLYPWAKTPATQAVVVHLVGVVANYKMGQSVAAGIPAKSWGLVQIRGYCSFILGTAAVTAGNFQTTTNTTLLSTDSGGTTFATNVFAIAKTSNAVSPYGYVGYLEGRFVAMP